jgi:hypothetical protein
MSRVWVPVLFFPLCALYAVGILTIHTDLVTRTWIDQLLRTHHHCHTIISMSILIVIYAIMFLVVAAFLNCVGG